MISSRVTVAISDSSTSILNVLEQFVPSVVVAAVSYTHLTLPTNREV